MNNIKIVVVLSALAVVLAATVVAAAYLSPVVGAALGVGLTGIAAVVRAVRGDG